MKSTLQSKIAAAMWIVTAVSTLASAMLTGAILVRSHGESIHQQLQATATSLVTLGINHFSELKDFSELDRFVEDTLQMDRVDKIIRIYDSSQKLLFTTAGADYDKLPGTLEDKIKQPSFLTIQGEQRRYESIVMPYEGAWNKKTFYLQVVIPLPPYTEILENLWWQSLLLLGVLIGISIVISQILSKRLLKPVGLIADHLQKMDPARVEDLKALKLGKQGRYLASIIDGINLLSMRTRTAILSLRKMSRYVAHEMRTPLTILRGEAEMALSKHDAGPEDYEKVLRSSLEEIQRMSEIVSTVLKAGDSARTAPFLEPGRIDVAMWLEENLASWEKALGRAIELKIPGGQDLVARADPGLLHRLVDNLVRNIRSHAPEGTACSISLLKADSGVILSVEDDGPGLPQEILTSLNQDGSSSDIAGVGLNLCYRIAEINGIRLHFSRSPSGGLKADIHFDSEPPVTEQFSCRTNRRS